MNELERYLRVYLTARISMTENQIKHIEDYRIDIPNATSIIARLTTRLEAFKEILELLDKDMME